MVKGAFSYKIFLLAAVSAACGGTLALRGNAGPTIEQIWQGGVTATSTAGGGGESARAGGMGMGQGGSSAMAQFREAQKYTFQLMRLARGLRTLTEGGQDTLSAAQAKAILAVLQPLRDQPKLTQDQAKETIRAIQATLTEAQRRALAQQRNQRSGAGGGMMGGGMGGPGGASAGGSGGAPGGGRPRFDPAAMKDFNPFARQAGANAPGPGGRGRSMDDLFTALEKLSAGAK